MQYREIGPDVSWYRPKLNKKLLEGKFSWMSAKAVEVDDRLYNGWNANMAVDDFVDASFADHCQTAYDLRADFVPYIYLNPQYRSEYYASAFRDHKKHPNHLDPEILALLQALKNKYYAGFGVDVERWWRRYNQYYEYQKKGEASKIETIPSVWIRDSVSDFVIRFQEEQQKGNFRDVPIIFYFGYYFVQERSPELDTYLADKLQWSTQYHGLIREASLKTSATKLGSWDDLPSLANSMVIDAMQTGNRPANILQLTDKYFLPGITDMQDRPLAVDINMTVSDPAQLFKPRFEHSAPKKDEPPIVIISPKVKKTYGKTKRSVNLRFKPTKVAPPDPVTILPAGVELEILEIKTDAKNNTWAKVAFWVADVNDGVSYLDKREVEIDG